MAIAYDSAVAGTRTSATSSLTYSFTNAAGDAIFVGAGVEWTAQSVDTITYAASGLTSLWNFASGGWGNAGFYKVAPATGANNVVVTMTGAIDTLTSGAISLSGVHQTVPVGTPNTATGFTTTPTVTVDSVNADDMVVDGVSISQPNDDFVVGANQTERYQSGGANLSASFGSTQSGADGGVMSWQSTGASVQWHIGAVAFKPAGGGGSSAPMYYPRKVFFDV